MLVNKCFSCHLPFPRACPPFNRFPILRCKHSPAVDSALLLLQPNSAGTVPIDILSLDTAVLKDLFLSPPPPSLSSSHSLFCFRSTASVSRRCFCSFRHSQTSSPTFWTGSASTPSDTFRSRSSLPNSSQFYLKIFFPVPFAEFNPFVISLSVSADSHPPDLGNFVIHKDRGHFDPDEFGVAALYGFVLWGFAQFFP